MSKRADLTGGRPIAGSVFALVLVSVLVATLIFFAVTFSGPPPREPPRNLSTIARSLLTGAQPTDPGPRFQIANRAPSLVSHAGQRRDPRSEARIARDAGVLPADVRFYTGRQPGWLVDAVVGDFTAGLRTGATWRIVAIPPTPAFTHWHAVTLAAMLTAILLLALPAWLIARALARPLRQLATAADRARAGAALAQLPTGGAREIRRLSVSVSTMHARLAAHAEGRTTMLGAIAHDLGTPLSRVAFYVEQLPEPARSRAAGDIEEMRAMIGSALAFARDETGEQATTRIDLGALIDSLVEDMAATGAPVTLEPGERTIVRGDSGALRRMFANLIDNAIRYGDHASVRWAVGDGVVDVTIDDRGRRIDPARTEQLFEPFVRGDPSRNRATGGSGLGLAIVRTIAVRHAGAATLEDGPDGMRARVTLPLEGSHS